MIFTKELTVIAILAMSGLLEVTVDANDTPLDKHSSTLLLKISGGLESKRSKDNEEGTTTNPSQSDSHIHPTKSEFGTQVDTANMHHMILSVLGKNGNKKLMDSSSEDSLVKKLMDGAMVVTDEEANKNTNSDQGDVKHYSVNETQPLHILVNLYPSASKVEKVTPGGSFASLNLKTSCSFNGTVYDNDDFMPTSHPCDKCKCKNAKVVCYWQQCDGAPGFDCVPLFIPGSCCPVYSCKNN